MKYIVLLCDGMSDLPLDELGGKTPMQVANKPNMDRLAKISLVGMVKTVDDSLSPGSDVANLSVMGYNPLECYSGRSPLEAASIGVELGSNDVSLRCNFITLSKADRYEDREMLDYCAGDISTAEADELIRALNEKFADEAFKYYTGFCYRHCLVWKNGTTQLGGLIPPHDISGRKIGDYLPNTEAAEPIARMMRQACDILENHPVNMARAARGEAPANGIWLWGEGKKPNLEPFREKFGIDGAVVSAVDLLKGIGKCARMRVMEVEGATGYIDTNFEGKTAAALAALESADYVYLHIEAPDECGHRRETANKIRSIELIDSRILGPLLNGMKQFGDFRLLIAPDHPTPLSIGSHTSDPVPFLLYDSRREHQGVDSFSEQSAMSTGNMIDEGYKLMLKLLEKK